MPAKATRQPTDQPDKFVPPAVTIREIHKRPGRPANPKPPAEPDFQFRNEDEKEMYLGFIDAIKTDYPKLLPSELLLLPLAAAEYVKFCRLLQSELSTGELVTMSRQHPGNMFARLLKDLLGTTRTQRIKTGNDQDEDETPWFANLNAG